MVTKSKTTGTKKGSVKVAKLNLNKETVKDLTSKEGNKIKGGIARTSTVNTNDTCASLCTNCRAC